MTNNKTASRDSIMSHLSNSDNRAITSHFANFNHYDTATLLFYNYTSTVPTKLHIYNDVGCSVDKILTELKDKNIIDDKNLLFNTFSSENSTDEKTGDFEIERHKDHLIYVIEPTIWLEITCRNINIYYGNISEDSMDIINNIEKCVHGVLSKVPKKRKLYLVEKTSFGYGLNAFEISNPSNDKLDLYYNDDLKNVEEMVNAYMQEKYKTGIYIFYGPPGTGKTTYIRHLIANTERRVIYIPQFLTQSLGEPEFISLMMDNPGAILVMEDSEKCLVSRDTDSHSFVANLLNLTDGLLGDCMRMQVICTFNTDLENIDKALLRKGRLLAKYDFNKLEANKCNNLFKVLELENSTTEPMSLAEIFNIKTENDFAKNRKTTIGFKTTAESTMS